jgi:hypothetical protein
MKASLHTLLLGRLLSKLLSWIISCQARKTLRVQPVGTDRTVSVELVEHEEIHLYTNVTHVRSQRERHVKW